MEATHIAEFDSEAFGRGLRVLRERAGLTAQELTARALMVDPGSNIVRYDIEYFESGRRGPSLRKARAIAKALETNSDAIVDLGIESLAL